MLRNMIKMAREELGLDYWLPPLGPYPLKDKVGLGVACVTLRITLRKWIYVGPLQWDSTRKGLTARENLYGDGVLVLGGTIYSRYGKKFMETP